jgi:hypothetical protein
LGGRGIKLKLENEMQRGNGRWGFLINAEEFSPLIIKWCRVPSAIWRENKKWLDDDVDESAILAI